MAIAPSSPSSPSLIVTAPASYRETVVELSVDTPATAGAAFFFLKVSGDLVVI